MKKNSILPIVALLSLVSCNRNTFLLEDKLFCFDTLVDVKLYEGEESYLNDILNILKYYDKISDNYNERSDVKNVYTLNQTNDNVTVDSQFYKMLKAAKEITSEKTKMFNPLCGSLSKKWKEALAEGHVLDKATISEELLKLKSSEIVLKSNNVVQRFGQGEIDLGGFAKGYTLDIIKTYLDNKNIKSYLIDAGNSSILLGEKSGKDSYFTVGINGITNAYLRLKNCFVSTSGIATQGVKIGDITYSHIINPVNGSAINIQDTVIVVSDKGGEGDAFSTALVNYTVEQIKTFETNNNVQTVVIKDGEIIYHHENLEVYYH